MSAQALEYRKALTALLGERGSRHLTFHSTHTDGFMRDYRGETSGDTADPGQDPRGAPDLSPLLDDFDLTPRRRDPHCYPRLGDANG